MHKDDVARISSPKQDLLRNLPDKKAQIEVMLSRCHGLPFAVIESDTHPKLHSVDDFAIALGYLVRQWTGGNRASRNRNARVSPRSGKITLLFSECRNHNTDFSGNLIGSKVIRRYLKF